MFMMCGAFPGVYLYIPLLTQSSPSFLAHAGQGVPLQSAQTEIFSVHFDLFFKLRTAAFLGFRILLRTSRPFYTQKGRPQSSIPEFFSVQPFFKFASEAQKDDHNPWFKNSSPYCPASKQALSTTTPTTLSQHFSRFAGAAG